MDDEVYTEEIKYPAEYKEEFTRRWIAAVTSIRLALRTVTTTKAMQAIDKMSQQQRRKRGATNWTADEEDELVLLVREGKRVCEISKIMCRTEQAIWNKLGRLGISGKAGENEQTKS